MDLSKKTLEKSEVPAKDKCPICLEEMLDEGCDTEISYWQCKTRPTFEYNGTIMAGCGLLFHANCLWLLLKTDTILTWKEDTIFMRSMYYEEIYAREQKERV